jgi:hypothetical protein
MNELGIVIYSDGEITRFGKAIYADQEEYHTNPGHQDSFFSLVFSTQKFKESNLKYIGNEGFFGALEEFAKQGLITILNNKHKSTDPDNILVYMPDNPTVMQLDSLRTLKLDNILNQVVLEFRKSEDGYIEYDDINAYVESKTAYHKR